MCSIGLGGSSDATGTTSRHVSASRGRRGLWSEGRNSHVMPGPAAQQESAESLQVSPSTPPLLSISKLKFYLITTRSAQDLGFPNSHYSEPK